MTFEHPERTRHDHTQTPNAPMRVRPTEDTTAVTAHAAVTRGIERALADLGVDLVGCAPSVLSGHVLKELREAGLLRTPGKDEAEKPAVPRELLDLMDTISEVCRFHGDDFGFLGRRPDGQPRCDSCKQPWLLRRARAAVLRGAS